jgi:hypothetical protein
MKKLLSYTTILVLCVGCFAELNVTPGAMYSLQLVNIKGEMVKNHGFTAEEVRVVKSLDYREVPNGSYDLTLMDTQGNITKVPLIIQR